MKAGDLVEFATGHGRETKIGVLLEVVDNPADLEGTYPILPPRKVARVFCEGKKWSSWLAHVEVISEGR